MHMYGWALVTGTDGEDKNWAGQVLVRGAQGLSGALRHGGPWLEDIAGAGGGGDGGASGAQGACPLLLGGQTSGRGALRGLPGGVCSNHKGLGSAQMP